MSDGLVGGCKGGVHLVGVGWRHGLVFIGEKSLRRDVGTKDIMFYSVKSAVVVKM